MVANAYKASAVTTLVSTANRNEQIVTLFAGIGQDHKQVAAIRIVRRAGIRNPEGCSLGGRKRRRHGN